VTAAVPGALNFRDVGGLPAAGGRTRSGVLYRSGDLSRLDDDGRAALEGLGVRHVIDLRSDDVEVLEQVDAILQAEAAAIIASRGVRFEFGIQSRSQPTKLSAALGDRISDAARTLGYSPRRMLSGGGHDAAAFAQAGWDSVMVFLRNWNGSHNPDEAMDTADLAAAVETLQASLGGKEGNSSHE